jgi:hypothetical protein
MTFPAKARRKIIVDDKVFFWLIRKKPTWNEVTDDPYMIPIQHVNGGRLLRADIGFCRSEYVDRTIPVVTPSIVERIIRFAIESGWECEVRDSHPLTLDCAGILLKSDSKWDAFDKRKSTS